MNSRNSQDTIRTHRSPLNIGERTTGMFIVGDRWQQASCGDIRPWHTGAWKFTIKCEFVDSHRCTRNSLTSWHACAHENQIMIYWRNGVPKKRGRGNTHSGRHQTTRPRTPGDTDDDLHSSRCIRGQFLVLAGKVSTLSCTGNCGRRY